jgi:hypothetical protein
LKTKLKDCAGCKLPRVIWKRVNNIPYCRPCYVKAFPVIKEPVAGIRPIRSRSPKRASQEAKYNKNRLKYLEKNELCLARLLGCTYYTTDIHHKQGREGDLLLDESKWLPVCRNCHDTIEMNPLMAKEHDLSLSRLAKTA